MNDAHRVRLGEPNPELMRELVVGRVRRGIARDAHGATLRPPAVILDTVTPAITALEGAGIDHTVHEYVHGDSLRDFGLEAAGQLGLEPECVFKTLVVVADGEPAVAIVPVSGRLALKPTGRALGAKRVEMCDSRIAERITGYVRGGISPFGQRRRLTTVLDESAQGFDVIYVSGGKRGLDLGVDPATLVEFLDAVVAPITS